MSNWQIAAFGDRMLSVMPDQPDPGRLAAWLHALQASPLPGQTDVVSGIRSLVLHYEPLAVDPTTLQQQLDARLASITPLVEAAAPVVEIPVWYGGIHGPDLADLAARAGLTEAEVIARHSAAIYTVDLLGFLPGFAYLGGLDPALHCPRRATPRPRVPAGSVAIGGDRTAVYPFASPGGWQLIGRTALTLFDADREPPAVLAAGQRVRFLPQRGEAPFDD